MHGETWEQINNRSPACMHADANLQWQVLHVLYPESSAKVEYLHGCHRYLLGMIVVLLRQSWRIEEQIDIESVHWK